MGWLQNFYNLIQVRKIRREHVKKFDNYSEFTQHRKSKFVFGYINFILGVLLIFILIEFVFFRKSGFTGFLSWALKAGYTLILCFIYGLIFFQLQSIIIDWYISLTRLQTGFQKSLQMLRMKYIRFEPNSRDVFKKLKWHRLATYGANLVSATILCFLYIFFDKHLFLSIAILLLIANFRLLSEDLVPPAALVLTTSSSDGLLLLGKIQEALNPLRVISLLDRKIEPKGIHRHREKQESESFRELDENEWQSTVQKLMDIVPFIVLDARVKSQPVIEEAKWIIEKQLEHQFPKKNFQTESANFHLKKQMVFFVTGPNLEMPVLDSLPKTNFQKICEIEIISEKMLTERLIAVLKMDSLPLFIRAGEN